MGAAAAQTIALRSLLLTRAAAGGPNAGPEIMRMTMEKALAAASAGAAFATHAPGLWRLWFDAAAAPWLLSGATARAASAALAPYGRAARANAKRLSTRRRMA